MRILLVLLIALLGCSDLICAETYRCRDSEGRLHVTDNLQQLPEECREHAKTPNKKTPDNLNFVPDAELSKDVKRKFEWQVREADKEVARKKAREADLLKRSENAADRFEQAQKEKRQAKRRWTYRSRETIKKADAEMARARELKQQLMQELDGNGVAREVKDKIFSILKRITE